jgi:hypothetical protein
VNSTYLRTEEQMMRTESFRLTAAINFFVYNVNIKIELYNLDHRLRILIIKGKMYDTKHNNNNKI